MEVSETNRTHSSNATKATEESPEESSWTCYIEDFLYEDESFFSSGHEYRTIVSDQYLSDAASSAVEKHGESSEAALLASPLDRKRRKKLITDLKRDQVKGKGGALWNDHDLEDTASSPVKSPKANDSGYDDESTNMDEADGDHCTELKMMGKCLVPLSTFRS